MVRTRVRVMKNMGGLGVGFQFFAVGGQRGGGLEAEVGAFLL